MNQVGHPTIVAVLLVLAGTAMGKTLHVPTTDYPTIQAAIDAAATDDKIAVAPGTYTENINFLGKAIHLHSRSRDPKDTTIQGTGSGSVVTCNNSETSATILEGFTITGAYVNAYERGGGMYNEYSSPTVTNCTFSNNSVSGMYNWPGSPTVTNCTFSSNSGSGIFGFDSSLTVTDCTFVDNTGSGIGSTFSSATVTNCTFSDNLRAGMNGNYADYAVTNCTFSSNLGGGIHISHGGQIVTNCTFSNNSGYGVSTYETSGSVSDCTFADNGGGMLGGNPYEGIVSRCTFKGNSIGMATWGHSMEMQVSDCLFSYNSGDGIQNEESSGPIVTNSIFINNGGRGVYNLRSGPTMTNCTFVLNSGGGIYNVDSDPDVTNCILWCNAGGQIIGDPGTVTYSDVKGALAGEGNIDADPLFVDMSAGDLRLAPGSPCIDAGTNSPAGGLPPRDIEGNPRPVDGNGDGVAVADMGAYEASGKHRPARK